MRFQAEILSDGMVDFDEYERATLAAMQCYHDAGFDVVGPITDSLGFLTFSYGGVRDPNELQDRLADLSCEMTYLDLVSAAYSAVNAPTASEVSERTLAYAACLEEEGVAVEAQATSEEMDALSIESGTTRCMAAHSWTATVITHEG